jgi:hypothetical protein
MALSRKLFGIRQMCMHTFLLRRTSQNIYFSSWDTCITKLIPGPTHFIGRKIPASEGTRCLYVERWPSRQRHHVPSNVGIFLQDYTVPQSIRKKCNITFPSVDVLKLKIYSVLADCKGFWQQFIMLGINSFWTLSMVRHSKEHNFSETGSASKALFFSAVQNTGQWASPKNQ